MNPPGSYDDPVLDIDLNQLDVIEATLTPMPVPSKELADSDFDDLFGPTFDTVILQHLDLIDAAIREKLDKKPTTPRSPPSPFINDTPTLTDSQATLCCDDAFPGSSSEKLLLSPASPSKLIGKRKATNLGDEEGTMGTQRRPSKRGRGQTTHSRSRIRPPPHALRHTETIRGAGVEDPVSDDPIDFLPSSSQ